MLAHTSRKSRASTLAVEDELLDAVLDLLDVRPSLVPNSRIGFGATQVGNAKRIDPDLAFTQNQVSIGIDEMNVHFSADLAPLTLKDFGRASFECMQRAPVSILRIVSDQIIGHSRHPSTFVLPGKIGPGRWPVPVPCAYALCVVLFNTGPNLFAKPVVAVPY